MGTAFTADNRTVAGVGADALLETPSVGSQAVQLDGVSKRYPGSSSIALHATGLTVHAGEFFSILGPSGSGKTTMLRLIAGFEQPDTGAVCLAGNDVTRLPPNKRDVNTVFQNYALFPHLTVGQNIAYPLRMRRVKGSEADRRVTESLELVEMTGFENRLPHQLSGGQRQRIALARALVSHPQVLLLDEPLGALDLRLRQQMQYVLTSLQERLGITFIYVTHDQGEALSMSDRVAVMSQGRIEQIGSPEDLYYAPSNAFIARFVGKSNILDAQTVARIDRHALISGGEDARYVLRYESLAVHPEPTADGRICAPARVRDVLFLGTGREIALDCQGTDLIALVPARRERDVAMGDTVYCSFAPSDLVVLRDQRAS